MKYIMIIDNSITIRAIAELVLKNLGYAIIHAENGEIAFEKIAEIIKKGDEIALFIADINIKVMDGLNFIIELKKKDNLVPVIMLIDDVRDSRIKKCKELKVSCILVKPFSPEKLLNAVNDIISI